MHYKNYLPFLIFFALSVSVSAQGALKGCVVDQRGFALPFASLKLSQMADSTLRYGQFSTENGRFSFKDIPSGQYLFELHCLGYDTLMRSINIGIGEIDLGSLMLKEHASVLVQVEIKSTRSLVSQRVDRTVIDVQQLSAAAGGSALELISQSPNISIDRQNNAFSMNGRSGIVIAINGKRTRLDETAVIQWLSGMPASQIEKIELIHTPPASYDAEGSAGVLNIVLKRSADQGYGGNFSLHGGYGEKAKYGFTANTHYNRQKLHLFADLALNANHTQENTSIYIAVPDGDGLNESWLDSKRPAYKGFHTLQLGAEIDLWKGTTLHLGTGGHLNLWSLDATTQTISKNAMGAYSLSVLSAKEVNNWRHWGANTSLQHRFSAHGVWNIDYDYLYYYAHNPTDYNNQDYNENNLPTSSSEFISRKGTPISVHVVKTDYSHSISQRLRFETGIKGSFFKYINDVNVANLITGQWVRDGRFSGKLSLLEDIGAVYASMQYLPNAKLTLNAGLRFEQTYSRLISREEGEIRRRNFGRIFPTGALSYQFGEGKQWQLSYTERITRPPFFWMAPAFFFFGPGVVLTGNPGVLPAYSRQATTSYKSGPWTFMLQASKERFTAGPQPLFDKEKQLVVFRVENTKSLSLAMFSLSRQMQYKWWSSQLNLSFFAQAFQVYSDQQLLRLNRAYLRFNTTQSIRFPASISLELTNQTSTVQQFGLAKVPFNTVFSAGIQKKIGQSNKITIHVFDLFNLGSFWAADIEQASITDRFRYEYEGSVVRITYLRDFGKSLNKKSVNRKSASDEERSRIQ